MPSSNFVAVVRNVQGVTCNCGTQKMDKTRVGTSSIYTVGQFDGFALVIDTHGGRVKSFINLGVGQFANK